MPDGKVPVGELTGSEYMGGLKSFVIEISEQQLTDKVTYVTADNYANLNDAVNGEYYNYKFQYNVKKTRQQGVLQTCECIGNMDAFLYEQVSFDLTPKKQKNNKSDSEDTEGEEERVYLSASDFLFAIGINARKEIYDEGASPICFNDFKTTMDLEQTNVTRADIISELFGWTSRIPQMMINFFYRGNTAYIIQRGYEPNRIDISETNHTKPIVERERERILWSSEPDSKTTVTKKTPGIEYIWKEKVEGEDKKSKYKYNKENLIDKKEVINDDGSRVETTYFYKKVDGANFLYLEREEHYEKYGDNNPTVTETYYTSLGQGQRSASVYRDGEYVGSSTGSTSGDDSASDYITKRAWLRLPKEETEEVTIPGNPLIPVDFPVNDYSKLTEIAIALIKLNMGFRETITMDTYNLEHIIDFTDQIIFEGKSYHLQSNKIEKTERHNNRQSISIVRWELPKVKIKIGNATYGDKDAKIEISL